jgi:glycerate dehydrogenase
MKIVILDGHTNNPGDLNWDDIASQGDFTYYERTAPEDVLSRCEDADIVFTNKIPFDKKRIDQLPSLKYIGILATGTNIIDLEYAAAQNICVTNIPGYSTDAVTQHILALMLHFSSKVSIHNQAVQNGDWVNCQDFSFTLGSIHELSGATLGIIGLGTIGRKLAAIASLMGMKIVAAHQSSMHRLELPYDVEWLPVADVFARADYLSLNCPLTPDTKNIVNSEHLKSMKSQAIIINTGRGPLVDEEALAEALNNNTIAGAGLDVLSSEPPAADNPLLSAKNCVITPHIAWASFEARKRLLDIAATNLKAFVNKKPVNQVN